MAEVCDATKRAYAKRLACLVNHLAELKISCDFLKNHKEFIYVLTTHERYKNCETRKGYYSTLLYHTRGKDAYPFYQNAFNECKKICNERAKDQTLPEERQANYCNREQAITVFQEAQQLYMNDPSQQTLEDLVVISLYTIQPPVRADYAGMLFTKDKPNSSGVGAENLCFDLSGDMFSGDMMWFCFGKYKTFKTYGWVDVSVDRDLANILRKWRDTYSPIHVYNGTPNMLCKRVMTLFKRHTGKATGIGLLRHSYIFDFYKGNPTLRQKELLAEKMLHSVAVQELYRTNEVVLEDIVS
jgi:hypothetical protein